MYCSHLVRVGVMGNVGRFASPDALQYPRGSRVIVRTARGLERGDVLGRGDEVSPDRADGTLLRAMTVEDELLEARLAKNREQAYDACARRIAEFGWPTVLLDVEHLFDGQSLVFYFLGDIPAELEAITGELAELYDAQAKFRDFAKTVEEGCGPGCGTEHATGGGCSSCATGCAVAGACSTRTSKHR
jgi:cell fate regulator YaaT (PSP1 superfamily)